MRGRFLVMLLSGLFFALSVCRAQDRIIPGAERMHEYIPELSDKRIAVVANHTSRVDSVHLVDTLLSEGVNVVRIFSPEHGFRGEAHAGEFIPNYKDRKTGVPVVSLYRERKKPRTKHLDDVDVLIFDIQDVGVRFYTYISTMHYVMEACAITGTKFVVLDRPNPNGFYIDGPVLDTTYASFVGIHPIPVVHGMTVAELARMINGEGWLKSNQKCNYSWVPCNNYTHDSLYRLPVKPSPNLPNMKSVYLYPSLGLFEGTVMNVGRGTCFPFQVFGHPQMTNASFEYTPVPMTGAGENPKHKGELCRAVDLRDFPVDSLTEHPRIRLEWIELAKKNTPVDEFFRPFFKNLSGNDSLMSKLKRGEPVSKIRRSWREELEEFQEKRKQYLIYKDFTSCEDQK